MGKGSVSYTVSSSSNNTSNGTTNNNNNNSSSSSSSNHSNGGGRMGDSKVEYMSKLCISEYAVYILDNMLSKYVSNSSNSSSGNSGSSSSYGSFSRQSYNSNNNNSGITSNSNNKASHISAAAVPTSSSPSLNSCEVFIAITGTLCFLSYIQQQLTSSLLPSLALSTAHTTAVATTQTCAPNSDSSTGNSNTMPDNQGSSRPDFLLSLDPGTKLAYLANHLISLLEKAPYQRYDISILILQLLLSMPIPYLSHRRGKWYTRLCIDLEHLISAPSPQSHVSISYYKYIHTHPSTSTTTTTAGTKTSGEPEGTLKSVTGNRNSQYNNITSRSSSSGGEAVTDSLRLASYAFCRMALSDPLVRVRYVLIHSACISSACMYTHTY